MGQHKNKNTFDLIVKVEQRQEPLSHEPSSVSLSSLVMRILKVTSRIQRPFDDCGGDGDLGCEETGPGEGSASTEEETNIMNQQDGEREGEGEERVLESSKSTSVVVEVVMEETQASSDG